MRRRARASSLTITVLVLLLGAAAGSPAQRSIAPSELPPAHREFLEAADLLLDKAERRAFLDLDEDYEREEFIRAFWAALDPDPSTPRNEVRDAWLERIEVVREELGEVTSDRARVLLLNGFPDRRLEAPCPSFLFPVEAWTYAEAEQLDGPAVVIFVAPMGSTRFSLWRPLDGPHVLVAEPLVTLEEWWRRLPGFERRSLLRRLETWLAGAGSGSRWSRAAIASLDVLTPCDPGARVCEPGRDQEFFFFLGLLLRCPDEVVFAHLVLEAVALDRTQPFIPSAMTVPRDRSGRPEEGWLERFLDERTDLPRGAREMPASLDIAYGGRRGARTVVEGTVRVPPAAAETLGDPAPSYRFRLNGEVLREGELFESFQYVFELPVSPALGGSAERAEELRLVFQRYLRPGEFRLVLRVADLNGGAVARLESALEVPAEAAPASGDRMPDAETTAGRAIGTTLTLEVPGDGYLAGLTRLSAAVVGPADRVAFLLDGSVVGAKTRPPFSLELDLGPVPRPRTLEAVAYDEAGEEVARDELELNRGEHRFAVRIVEPRDGERHSGTVRLRADVSAPEDAALERVDVYLDERRLATLYQEPYELPLPIGNTGIALLRCVATLADGSSTEDAILLNTPGASERLDVRLVELHASFVRAGRPVTDVDPASVTVLEDGERREILRFERVQDLPLHLGVLIDTSASMENSLMAARSAALTFFEQNVRPKDRVFVATFHERAQLRVPFTNDLETMKSGLRILAAGRGTAFYDSLVFALYQFAGIRGPRGLLVLSDGRDEDSRFSFEDTLELARRSGVPLYTVGLKAPKTSLARSKLAQLAAETGGRGVVLRDIDELLPIYEEIEDELRSRYLIAFQTAVEGGDLRFRRVEIVADDPALEARSAAGFYP